MANLQVGVAGNGTVTVGAGASVHSPASNTLTLGTNGDERLRITSAGKVGIGEDTPLGNLHIKTADSGASVGASNDELVLENSSHTGMTILSGTTSEGGINFGDSGDVNQGRVVYMHDGDYMYFHTNSTERLRIESGGRVNIVGICSAAGGFVGDGSSLTGVASTDNINTSTPATMASINATGIVTATAFVPSEGQLGRKNMIINGDCRVAQRGTSITTGTGNFATYTLDQWKVSTYATDQLNITVTQEAMNQAIPGLANFIKVSPNAAESGGAADEYTHVRQSIEAKDCQRLKWGTASAESATLSFWVKSNTTGTACICFNKHDATSYYITRTYTINAADTWEYKTVTIPGNTASGIANDTGIGINIFWFLDAGSNYKTTDSTSWVTTADGKFAYGHNINLIDSTSDYLALAGVQFEVGTVDTPFEHLTYTEELALCQRYFWGWINPATKIGFCNAYQRTSDMFMANLRHPVEMRASPTLATSTDTGDFTAIWVNSGGDINSSGITTPGGTYDRRFTYPIAGTLDSGSYGSAAIGVTIENDGTLTFSAEL